MERMQAAAQIDLRAMVAGLAPALGFDLSGVARVEEFPELSRFESWINEHRAGEMTYLASQTEKGELKRARVRNAVPWAKSAVVVAVNYNSAAPYSTDPAPKTAGWISRYAWFENPALGRNSDYHDAVLQRLRKLEDALVERSPATRTWTYVDTGPIVERVLAKYAGLGWTAKNTCLINEQAGSFLFLGVILTSVELPAEHVNLPLPDRCGSCTRCIEACPTQAITAPYELDPRRCISYLTIEKKGTIPEGLRSGMGRQVFGCDICQDVCPWNGAVSGQRPRASDWPEFTAKHDLVNPDLVELAQLTPEAFAEKFRHSPVKRSKYQGFMRNVAIALGNSGDERGRPALEKLAESEDAGVAEHARWALRALGAGDSDETAMTK